MDTTVTVGTGALTKVHHALNRAHRALVLYREYPDAGHDAAEAIAEAMHDLGELRAALVAELTEVK